MEGLRQRKRPPDQEAKEDTPEKERSAEPQTVTELEPGTYWMTRILFLRFLGFIYLVAFLISFHQNKELIGDRGLTPARLFLRKGEIAWLSASAV